MEKLGHRNKSNASDDLEFFCYGFSKVRYIKKVGAELKIVIPLRNDYSQKNQFHEPFAEKPLEKLSDQN